MVVETFSVGKVFSCGLKFFGGGGGGGGKGGHFVMT